MTGLSNSLELDNFLRSLDPQAQDALLKELGDALATPRFLDFFPDQGKFRRELYRRHLEFFRLGREWRFRAFMAANRVGKTSSGGGYEVFLHLTGLYPPWWEGHRFSGPIEAWAAGDTKETVRDIIQAKLFGRPGMIGTGLIPGELVGRYNLRPNSGGAIDTVEIKHVSGGWSLLGFKSYDQKRVSFQGTEKHLIWLDEESDEGIRDECVIRLMTTQGLLIETFTPLKGITPVVMQYTGEGAEIDEVAGVTKRENRVMVNAGWDDVPHLSEKDKEEVLQNTLPYLRDARSKGTPSLGAGAIFPVPESEIVVQPFRVPAEWPACYALDVGWNRTAALWGAWDREIDTVYLVAEHYRGQAEPPIHAAAIRAKGDWIPGVIDPAARGRAQDDGRKLMKLYRDLGLDLQPADNAVEAGLQDVWIRLSTGRLKVFKSLTHWLAEYRMYRRDEKGRIVEGNDHLMDDTRYLIRSGLKRARVRPQPAPPGRGMGVLDPVAGY